MVPSRVFSAGVIAAVLLALVTAASAASAAPQGDPAIFADGFELGDLDAWSSAVGATPPDAFRFTDLDLRDPHVFVSALVCFDFTDTPLPGDAGPAFNDSLEALITGDDDLDGFLDYSPMLLFRPLDVDASSTRVDLRRASCTAPAETTVCSPDPAAPPDVFTYSTLDSGICYAPDLATTSGYAPGIPEPAAPCFVTSPQDIVLELAGGSLPLLATRIAGRFDGEPVTGVSDGVLAGFLREVDAEQVLLPADLPIVGGEPITVLLPGGEGNCAPGDDTDVVDEELGWWFYLEFSAAPAPYTGT